MSLNFKKVHFIGAGGAGMSAIAEILLDMKYQVSGSDVATSESLDRLRQKGATIYIGQRKEQITNDIDVVVHSTAILENNPERQMAIELGIPVLHRSEMLAELTKIKRAICVAGCHGKTTTSSMIALIFEKNNYDPTIAIGGIIKEIKSNAKYGASDIMVAEADESDGSFVNLFPWYTVVTNIDEDHVDHYKNVEEIKAVFETFVRKTASEGHVLLCADCPTTLALKHCSPVKVTTYGYDQAADYRIVNRVQNSQYGNEADLFHQDKFIGHISLKIPGAHNVLNATAAIICAMSFGLEFDQASQVLEEFMGTHRRFQLIGEINNIKVIDDYAHHPTEIFATIRAARDVHKDRLIVIFQPHRYSRTAYLAEQFAQALKQADDVYLLDVFPAGEEPIDGVSSELIVDHIGDHLKATVVDSAELPNIISDIASEGDMILVMGAGSIWKRGPEIVEALKEKHIK